MRIEYPKVFTECITTSVIGQWMNTSDHYWIIGNTDRKTFCQFVKNGDTNRADELYWIAIGI